ncbi:TPA: hypothetical protein J7141_004259 [Escherichia coli]|nr:hypothetical protein [Escherichia coli]
MIVKFHARGKGGGSGPVDYLLGRERNREGATVLQGNPEDVGGQNSWELGGVEMEFLRII